LFYLGDTVYKGSAHNAFSTCKFRKIGAEKAELFSWT